MRTISSTLEAAQQADTIDVIYKIVLTKGASEYTYTQTRILPSEHDEGAYSHKATVVLDNSDGEFDNKNLRGFKAVLYYGATTGAGDEYSETAPLSVIDQQFNSVPGKLTCELDLAGIPDMMMEDEASDNYTPDEEDNETVKSLVDAIAGATLDCFSHCKAYDVVWDAGYDTLADTYKPKDGFSIPTGGSRLAAFKRVLDFTANVPRFEADGKIHILQPVTSGPSYDYEYNLQDGHTFFQKAYRETLVIPNRIVVKSKTKDDPQYCGAATIDGYDSLPDEVKKTEYVRTRLQSNSEGDEIAEALIKKAEVWSSRGSAEVPINVGAEIFDYIKVTDQRQGDSRTGNVGYIHRRFGGGKWSMTFGFGNWLEWLKYRSMLKELEVYGGDYFKTLTVETLYATDIWLTDFEGTLDDIEDGETYVRKNWVHLDASGVYVGEETLYSLRIPGEGENNLWKSNAPLSDPEIADIWIDTNYTPNKVKRWNGSSWVECTPEQLEQLNRGVIVRRLKGSALTANGLVVLDEVHIGEDEFSYDLLYRTDISAHHILLSEYTEAEGEWYLKNGVAIHANKGIAIFGGPGLSGLRTYPTAWDYVHDLNVQCYVGTDGSFFAGNGKVWLDEYGLHIKGLYFDLYDDNGNQRGQIYGGADALNIAALSGQILRLQAATGGIEFGGHLMPQADGTYDLGSISKEVNKGYFKSRLKIPVGTDLFD